MSVGKAAEYIRYIGWAFSVEDVPQKRAKCLKCFAYDRKNGSLARRVEIYVLCERYDLRESYRILEVNSISYE